MRIALLFLIKSVNGFVKQPIGKIGDGVDVETRGGDRVHGPCRVGSLLLGILQSIGVSQVR